MKMPDVIVLAVLGLASAAASCHAAQAMTDLLAGPAAENFGWTFDNGREFPGASGRLSVDAAAKHNGKDSLRLDGDFTKGGNYVQAAGPLPGKDIREISFWLRAPGSDGLALRIIDGSGQCHQITLKIQQTDDWQQVVFPLARFFAKRGTPEAAPIVAKYEFWGGANDGQWHGPGKTLVVLTGPSGDKKVRTLWLNDVKAVDAPPAPAVASAGDVKTLVKLDEAADGQTEWTFDNGQEFRGAKGSLSVVKIGDAGASKTAHPTAERWDEREGQSCLKLAGDFTGGGAESDPIPAMGHPSRVVSIGGQEGGCPYGRGLRPGSRPALSVFPSVPQTGHGASERPNLLREQVGTRARRPAGQGTAARWGRRARGRVAGRCGAGRPRWRSSRTRSPASSVPQYTQFAPNHMPKTASRGWKWPDYRETCDF